MSENEKIENFIPINKNELTNLLSKNFKSPQQKKDFLLFCNTIQEIYHQKFFNFLRDIEKSYIPIDPDINTVLLKNYSKQEKELNKKNTIKKIKEILIKANYNEISREKLNEAFKKKSPWGLDLKVNQDDFTDFFLYYKDHYADKRTKKIFYLFNKEYKFDVYSRVVILFKLKENHKIRKDNLQQDKLYIKLFKNVPEVDIEMLFPNIKIKISTFDKLSIIIPLIAGICTSIYQIINYIIKQGHDINILLQTGFLGLIGGFFGLALRSFIDYQNTVEKYLKNLTTSLYFENLDNNKGVYEYLIAEAEEQEFKELILGYFILFTESQKNYNAKTLDSRIEKFIKMNINKNVDFEMTDSIKKLKNLGLLEKEKPCLKVIPLQKAIKILKTNKII